MRPELPKLPALVARLANLSECPGSIHLEATTHWQSMQLPGHWVRGILPDPRAMHPLLLLSELWGLVQGKSGLERLVGRIHSHCWKRLVTNQRPASTVWSSSNSLVPSSYTAGVDDPVEVSHEWPDELDNSRLYRKENPSSTPRFGVGAPLSRLCPASPWLWPGRWVCSMCSAYAWGECNLSMWHPFRLMPSCRQV